MSQFTVVLLIAIFSLIILFVWNGFNYRSLKNLSDLSKKELNDAKYWELKYKHEFLIAIVGLITAAAGFLGYNSLQSIESAVKRDFDEKVDSVQKNFQVASEDINIKLRTAKDSLKLLNGKFKSSESLLQRNSSNLNDLNGKQSFLKEKGDLMQNKLLSLSNEIDTLNKSNKIKKEFYLVTNIKLTGLSDPTTFKFANLKTSTGDRLPQFKKPPIVLTAYLEKAEIKISSITATEFQVQVFDYGGITIEESEKKTYNSSFIIYEVE